MLHGGQGCSRPASLHSAETLADHAHLGITSSQLGARRVQVVALFEPKEGAFDLADFSLRLVVHALLSAVHASNVQRVPGDVPGD